MRTINKIGNLYDVSIVANPAYTDTSVALRSLDAFKAQEETQIPEEVKEEVKEETPVEETPVEEVPVEENKPEVQEETEPKEKRNNINNTKVSVKSP